jgi:hypothetical protein
MSRTSTLSIGMYSASRNIRSVYMSTFDRARFATEDSSVSQWVKEVDRDSPRLQSLAQEAGLARSLSHQDYRPRRHSYPVVRSFAISCHGY